jgi:citrate lyase subunit beta / citryl-CoA lyase
MTVRPRRSVLYMPGSNARVIDKARSLPADAIILDLEDAVAPDAKPEARALVCAAVQAGGHAPREVVIRVNAPSTPWGRDDLAAAAMSGADAILVPKIDGPDDVRAVSAMLDRAGAPAELGLWVTMEKPRAVLAAGAIAATATDTRLAAFVMGTNDLAKDTGARLTPQRSAFFYALGMCVTAARAHGLAVIDGVFNDIADGAGFEDACQQGLDFGFDGKTLIHPSQIAPCNRVFAPSADAIAQARAVVDAFADPANAGKGVLKVNGQMTELLHRDMAVRLLAIADAITALEDGVAAAGGGQ